MKNFLIGCFTLTMLASSLFAGTVELIEPAGIGPAVCRWMTGSDMICLNDSCSICIFEINTDSCSSNAFQPFVFRIESTHGVDWSTLYFSVVSHGGDLCYPFDVWFGWWDEWCYPDSALSENMWNANELSYQTAIDTLSDMCWIFSIEPGPKIQPESFVYEPACTIFWAGFFGPIWQITGDTLSPGFGQYFTVMATVSATGISFVVRDTLGGIIRAGRDIGFDFNGPVASQPYPPDSSTTVDTIPEIQVVILDTFTYDFYPYPDSSGGTIPPTEPHCACYEPGCTTATGEWLHYPYCAAMQIHRARIDTTSVRLSVNGREYTLESPGMHWLHDSLLVLNTEEAGLTFERGETVRVCLEEATDRTSQGYGPNHLGRYRDWTHPDTPIPFCWEFYIAGTGIEEASATPEEFGIKSIKPNPFNSRTEIKFELAKEAEVSITVYNIQGQKVESLMKGETLASGSHSVVWNADGRTPTGIYLIKLFAGAFEDVKKVILLK